MSEHVHYISLNIDTLKTNNNNGYVPYFFNLFDLLFILMYYYKAIMEFYLNDIEYCTFCAKSYYYAVKSFLSVNVLLFDKSVSSEIFTTVFFI